MKSHVSMRGDTLHGRCASRLTSGTDEWKKAMNRAHMIPAVRTGSARFTLLRVWLDTVKAGESIQAAGGKLRILDQDSGGSRYQEFQSGSFVILEHLQSTARRGNHDSLEVGSLLHGLPEASLCVLAAWGKSARKRARSQGDWWSGRTDSNRRLLAPEASALPGCATPRRARRIPYSLSGSEALPGSGLVSPAGLL